MAFSSADWTINYALKTVTNNDSGTGNNLPVNLGTTAKVGPIIDFFQWLATEFAATGQMDDTYPIQSDTPTVYKWLNGWTFGHADDFKYLEGGSIEDPAGSGTATADSLWSNVYSIGSQTSGTQIYMLQNDVEVTPWWISGNVDLLVLVKDTGVWIASTDSSDTSVNGGIWLYAREFGDLYDNNFGDLSGGGRNPVGVNTSKDTSNASGELYVTVSGSSGTWTVGNFLSDDTTGATGKIQSVNGNDIYLNAVRGGVLTGTNGCTEYIDRELQTAGDATATISSTTNVVAGWTTITDTFGTISRDLNNGNGAVNYDVEIDAQNTYSPAQVYEWLKYITRYGSTGATYTVNGDDGQEYRSAAETSAGGANSGGPYSPVKVAPFGTLAGTTFYGARGVWLANTTTSDFVLADADGDEQSPPNYQKVTAAHPSLVGCNIFVAERTGTAIVKNQYTISTVSTNTITATASIDINKAPQSGSLRIGDTVYAYTGYSGAVLSGVTPDPTGETGDFYIPLLDILADSTSELSDNIIYTADFDVRTTVRKYGFKPYDVDTSFGSTGLTFSPILTIDPQAT
jgi:hypothetical protein